MTPEELTALSEKAFGPKGSYNDNAAFRVALVNAWRSNELVTREEHERVRGFAEAMADRDDSIGDDARAALNGSN